MAAMTYRSESPNPTNSTSRRLHRPSAMNTTESAMNISLMRRGGADKDDLVVASLQLHLKKAKLHLLRHGEWSIQRPMFIVDGEGNKDGEQMVSSWQNHNVVSARDGNMFWVDFRQGLIFCNVYEEIPVLRYVRLPAMEEVLDRLSCRGSSRDVCVTSDGVVKFVSVDPRCCCGSL
ncbi:hypothetical protein HU200_029105 [Digitaria exilis]|uniref:DUF1618 domain-containing protein n=1 Tax=Digitaria exilis TaxID=1010633 RepID=A0A835EP89_9POAL|nr:hypothetical protein HU200_029105 [Digitaria exilis]